MNNEKIGSGNKKLLQGSNEITLVQAKKAGQSKVSYVYQYCGDTAKAAEDDVCVSYYCISSSSSSSRYCIGMCLSTKL